MFNYFHFNVAIPRKEIELFKKFYHRSGSARKKENVIPKELTVRLSSM